MDHSTSNASAPPHRSTRWPAPFRLPAMRMLIAILLFIIVSPFADEHRHGQLIITLIVTVLLVTATQAMGGRRWTLVAAIILLIPSLLARWAAHVAPGVVPPEVFSATSMLFVGFVAGNLFYFILSRSSDVNAEVLCAGISGYLLVGIFWAFAYTLVNSAWPGSFTLNGQPAARHAMQGFTAIYFSLTTLCTVGFGDIVPLSPAARLLAMMETLTGVIYMAVMIARLVGMHASRRHVG